jgi:CDP-4-dehydro-6-deoxyglucose reductase
MAYYYHDCEVINVLDAAPGVKRYILKYPETFQLDFKAGQFIMLDLPIDSKYTNRSYSIASACNKENWLELLIVLNPKGLGTPHLFDNVSVGSFLKASSPLGKFTLVDPIETDLCFVCTGTGVAPFRAMIQEIIQNNKPFKSLTLIMGSRKEEDLAYKAEFEKLAAENEKFKYYPVLSREESQTWKGFRGYVHEVYLQFFNMPSNTIFYLCGWSAMLKEAREKLLALVHDKKQIRFESYD